MVTYHTVARISLLGRQVDQAPEDSGHQDQRQEEGYIRGKRPEVGMDEVQVVDREAQDQPDNPPG